MLTLYIAGPMTGYPDYNRPAFHAADADLTAAGYTTLNPARAQGREGCETWQDYMRASLRDLADCDGIALLDDWQGSRGARLEYTIATRLGLPVYPAATWVAEPELVTA